MELWGNGKVESKKSKVESRKSKVESKKSKVKSRKSKVESQRVFVLTPVFHHSSIPILQPG